MSMNVTDRNLQGFRGMQEVIDSGCIGCAGCKERDHTYILEVGYERCSKCAASLQSHARNTAYYAADVSGLEIHAACYGLVCLEGNTVHVVRS